MMVKLRPLELPCSPVFVFTNMPSNQDCFFLYDKIEEENNYVEG